MLQQFWCMCFAPLDLTTVRLRLRLSAALRCTLRYYFDPGNFDFGQSLLEHFQTCRQFLDGCMSHRDTGNYVLLLVCLRVSCAIIVLLSWSHGVAHNLGIRVQL